MKLTAPERRVIEEGCGPAGVKVWGNRCWIGHEWYGRQIQGATADTKDALVARGFMQRMGEWTTLYETTEAGRAVLAPKS